MILCVLSLSIVVRGLAGKYGTVTEVTESVMKVCHGGAKQSRGSEVHRATGGSPPRLSPQTGYLTNNRHLFLTVLEAGKARIKVPADLVPDPLSGS